MSNAAAATLAFKSCISKIACQKLHFKSCILDQRIIDEYPAPIWIHVDDTRIYISTIPVYSIEWLSDRVVKVKDLNS